MFFFLLPQLEAEIAASPKKAQWISNGAGCLGVFVGDEILPKSMGIYFCNEPVYMGASKNRGTPKWMVYNGKP